MNIEQELVDLCKRTIDILYELKEKQLISEEELQLHLKEKKQFIEKFSKVSKSN